MLYNANTTRRKELHPMQTTCHEAILQNLKDAGCDPDVIARFMICQDAGKTKDSLRVLASHRATLLDELHASQAKPSWTVWTI